MKSRVLVVSAFPPNRQSGGETYTLRLLEDLTSAGFVVDLVYFAYHGHKNEFPNANSVTCWEPSYVNSLVRPWIHPIFTKRFSRRINRQIAARAKTCDHVVFNFSQVMFYSLKLRQSSVFLRFHDVLRQKFARGFLPVAHWVGLTEKAIVTRSRSVFAASAKDAALIKSWYGVSALVDRDRIVPFDYPVRPEEPEGYTFVFFGAWNRPENWQGLTWFIREVLPSLDRRIQFLVMGSGLTRTQRELLGAVSAFQVLGFVDDPKLVLFNAQGLLAPLFHGAGVKIKVLECLSTGTPVVGTDVALEGIDSRMGRLILVTHAAEWVSVLNNWSAVSLVDKQVACRNFQDEYKSGGLVQAIVEASK